MQQVADIAFVGPSYDYGIVGAARSINVRPEIHPTTKQLSLISRPGRRVLERFNGTGQAIWSMGGLVYTVAGNTVRCTSEQGGSTILGSVAGSGRFGVSHNGEKALLSTGTTDYVVTSTTVTEVTDGNILNGPKNTYHNGYWLKL